MDFFSKDFPNFQVVDSRKIEEKIFKCFAIVYNIDLKNRELILFAKQLKDERNLFELINSGNEYKNKPKNKKKEIIVYRNSNIDKNLNENFEGCKNIIGKKENINSEIVSEGKNFIFENIFIENKFDLTKLIEDKDKEIEEINKNENNIENNFSYLTRNKLTLI